MHPPSKRVKTWGYYANQQQQKHKSKYAWEWGRPHTITIKISAKLRFFLKQLFFIVKVISSSILFILILTLKFASWWICLSAPIFPMTVESKEARPLRPATAYRETCPIPSTPLWSSQQLCPKCLQTSQTVLYNTTPSPPPIIPSLANSDASLPIGKRGSPSTLHPAPPTNSTFPTILSSPYLHPQYLSPLPAPMPVFQPIFNLAVWIITAKISFTPSMIFYPYHSSPIQKKTRQWVNSLQFPEYR